MTQTPKKRRVAVFIDGSNFYFKLKTLVPKKMDMINYRYLDLIKSMLYDGEQISYFGYYVGVIRADGKLKNSKKAQTMRTNQQRLFAGLGKQHIEVVRGYLMEREGKFFEKGVDVRLAVDIVAKAYEKQYDIAFVVSSDTDLIPAIQKAIGYGKHVVHIGFEHQPVFSLLRYSSGSRMITRKEAEKFAIKPIKIQRFDD